MENFNKKEFSNILLKIYLKYNNQREFASVANVNRTYLSRYMNLKLDEPPTVKILRKIARASKGVTSYQQLMHICGYLESDEKILKANKNRLEQILVLAEDLNVQEINYLIKILNNSKIKIEKCSLTHK